MTLALALSVLTISCKTPASVPVIADDSAYRQALVALIPEPPEVPELPALRWTFEAGRYGLDESEVDKFLDFKENTLPAFSDAYLDWLAQLRIVLRELAAE